MTYETVQEDITKPSAFALLPKCTEQTLEVLPAGVYVMRDSLTRSENPFRVYTTAQMIAPPLHVVMVVMIRHLDDRNLIHDVQSCERRPDSLYVIKTWEPAFRAASQFNPSVHSPAPPSRQLMGPLMRRCVAVPCDHCGKTACYVPKEQSLGAHYYFCEGCWRSWSTR